VAYRCKDDSARIILRQLLEIRLDGSDNVLSSLPGFLGSWNAAEVDEGIEMGAAGRKGRRILGTLPLEVSWGDKGRHGTENAVAETSDKAKGQNV